MATVAAGFAGVELAFVVPAAADFGAAAVAVAIVVLGLASAAAALGVALATAVVDLANVAAVYPPTVAVVPVVLDLAAVAVPAVDATDLVVVELVADLENLAVAIDDCLQLAETAVGGILLFVFVPVCLSAVSVVLAIVVLPPTPVQTEPNHQPCLCFS